MGIAHNYSNLYVILNTHGNTHEILFNCSVFLPQVCCIHFSVSAQVPGLVSYNVHTMTHFHRRPLLLVFVGDTESMMHIAK